MLTVLLILAAVILLILVAGLIAKKEYELQRSIVIDCPRAEVFDYIRHLKNQDLYSKWVMTDPEMKKTFTGTDGTEGFIYAWDGNKKAGKGEQEITGIRENERLDVEVRFEKPFASIAQLPMTTETTGNGQTKLTWGMQGRSSFPLNLMNLVIMGMLKKDMDISLQNLKTILEKKAADRAMPATAYSS
ncbi:MAG TPA: SRPBCC family protein [Flavisolibacter sp.]|jgi:uncharacterized protein YndB with AHSA1/START domain|nr:SRPBCC family protein [Flavisolibacter sp.]